MNNSVIDIFMTIGTVICVLGWIGLYVYHKKTCHSWTFESIRIMRGVVFILCAIGAMLIIGVSNSKDSGWWLEQATAEKTPAQVFLRLTSESTEEDLQRIAEEQGLCVVASSKHSGKANAFYVIVDPIYLSHKEGKGVLLYVTFSRTTGSFESAELIIKTDDGTAECRCSISENGAEVYKLLVKTDWYIPKQVYYPKTVQDAVQIAYEAVYPNGFN